MIVWGVLSALLFVQLVKACEEPWTITSDEAIGGEIGFENITKVKKHESLSFSWYSGRGGRWSLQAWRAQDEDRSYGSFTYRKYSKREKYFASFHWYKFGGAVQTSEKGRIVDEPGWLITLCDGTQWEFVPEGNNYEFRHDNTTLNEEKEGSTFIFPTEEVELNEKFKMRFKRQEVAKEYPTYIPEEEWKPGQWLRTLNNFFFGEEDSKTGQRDGLFVRLAKWIKSMRCQLQGSGRCGQGGPPGQGRGIPLPPPPAVPPTPDDAEEIDVTTTRIQAEAENNVF